MSVTDSPNYNCLTYPENSTDMAALCWGPQMPHRGPDSLVGVGVWKWSGKWTTEKY